MRGQVLIAVLLGVLVLMGIFVRSDQPQHPHPHSYQYAHGSSNYQDTTSQTNGYGITKYLKQYAAYCDQKPNGSNSKWLHYTLCEKLNESVIAIFTAVLAVVTGLLVIVTAGLVWMALRQETMARTHERAYILCGGLLGEPNDGINTFAPGYRAQATDFHGPWRIGIHNLGRTPGFITKIEWGTCTDETIFDRVSVSQIIRDKTFPIETVETQEAFAPTGSVALHYRHVHPDRVINEVFFGKISYIDIFKLPRHSTFAIVHRKEHSDTIGKSFAEDWS